MLGGVVLARIKGEETTLGLIINSRCYLSLSHSFAHYEYETEHSSHTIANGVPLSMRLLSLLLINMGKGKYDRGDRMDDHHLH